MRQATREEVEEWTELAREHGYVDDEGAIALGRFVTEGQAEGKLKLTFVTPLVASHETDDGEPKEAPYMFDRTPDGGIIMSGRWLVEAMLAAVPASEAWRMTEGVRIPDAVMLGGAETVEMSVGGEIHEALPPGGSITIRLRTHD